MSEKKLQPIVESYNVDEEYLYNRPYLFIKGVASGRNFKNTLKALPLARQFHNGVYRKGLVEVNGQKVQLPYVLHPLKVCSTLMSLNLPMPDNELDLLYSGSLLHDTVEDAEESFPKGGAEFTQDYGFPPELETIIKLLSKHPGADEYELNAYFNELKVNKFALLIKLADRSHNVEDLYNMKNVPKYIKETRDYFISRNGLCAYGKANFPELSNGITILKAKIVSLTEATETIMEKYEHTLAEKDEIIKNQQEEINNLQEKLKKLI